MEAIDDLYINHVALPGLINVSMEIDGSSKTYTNPDKSATSLVRKTTITNKESDKKRTTFLA